MTNITLEQALEQTLEQTTTVKTLEEGGTPAIGLYKKFARIVLIEKSRYYIKLIKKELTEEEGLTHLEQRDKRNIEEFFLSGAFHGMQEWEDVDWKFALQTLRLRAKQKLEADLKEQKEKEKEEQAKSASAKTAKGKALVLTV